jgi:hypothetical protein
MLLLMADWLWTLVAKIAWFFHYHLSAQSSINVANHQGISFEIVECTGSSLASLPSEGIFEWDPALGGRRSAPRQKLVGCGLQKRCTSCTCVHYKIQRVWTNLASAWPTQLKTFNGSNRMYIFKSGHTGSIILRRLPKVRQKKVKYPNNFVI